MKNILTLIAILFLAKLYAQDVTYSTSEFLGGGNPHLVNTGVDNDAVSYTKIIDVSQTANKWSATQNLPSNFRFHFYGQNVTQYKVSLNGVITFTTSATTVPANNADLPTAQLPNKSIACFWDEFKPTGADDKVYVATKGTAPNRQVWIKWFSMKMGTTDDNYYACVLEEGTGNIYIVDMYTKSPLTSTQTATIGIQNSSTEGTTYANPLFLKSASTAYADNNYYQFSPSFPEVSNSYYSACYFNKKDNPLGINTSADTLKTGWTQLIGASKTANQWSSSTALPFSFEFFGETVTNYKVSINGVLTFTTSATSLPADNATLPSSSLPDKSIACFWDKFASTNTDDKVFTYTYGTAPNRQLWIKWYSLKYGTTASENNYFACVLEETSNRIYIVDLRNQSGATTLSASVGLQKDGSTAIEYASNLKLKASNLLSWDNNYFQFTPSTESPLLSYTEPSSAGTGNPGSLNTETDSYSPSSGGWTALTSGSISTNAWSSTQTLPIDFLFFGEAVTEYKVSSNGLLTFNTSTALLPSENDNLPSSSLPDNTIACFWDAFPGVTLSANDIVYYKTFGSSPNRQFWIKWYSMRTGSPYSSDNYYACVLEETTNKIYFVDMYNTGASVTQTMTVGVQYNANYAVQYGDNYYRLLSTASGNSNNYYYEFIPEEGETEVSYDESSLNLLSTKALCREMDDDCADTKVNSAYLDIKLSTGDIYNYGSNAFTETVNFTLTPYLTSGTGSESSEITLEIDQENPLQLYHLDISSSYEDLVGYKIKVKSYTSLNGLVANDLEMKAYYSADLGVDVSDVTVTTHSISSPTSANPITLQWESDCDKVPSYELQVLRLYNTSDGYEEQSRAVNTTVNWKDALSINTASDETSFTLSLTEGSGYYMWRVRPIGTYYENESGDSRNWGSWSNAYDTDDNVDISSVSDLTSDEEKYIFYYTQFDADKNWIYNRTFNDEGRVAEQISYANGLLQMRQVQRKLQEQEQVLAEQTVYDYVGRPSIHSMMAPIDQNKLRYVDTLVQNEDGNLYGPSDFDSDERYDKDRYPVCAGDPVDVPIWENPLPMYGLINDYYSDENPDINIPNAEKYPYTRTVYDKLNREKKTSLYGAEHRMGLYDETYMLGGLQRTVRTYYSNVSDTEMIKVFGNQTPADTGIIKIVRVDPNELPTVEYKNREGKTIATCIVNTGDHPLMWDVSENGDTIVKEIKGQKQTDPYTLVKEQVITFTDPTVQLDLDYILHGDEFSANCIDYCSSCDYVVQLYVIREETKEVKWSYTETITPEACGGDLEFNPDGADTSESLAAYYEATCPQMVLSATDASTIMLSDPGNYRIGRKITVNSKYDGEARYRDYHADTINALLDEEAAKFDTLFGYLDDSTDVLSDLYDFLDNSLDEDGGNSCDDGSSSGFDFDFGGRYGSSIGSKFSSSTLSSMFGSSSGIGSKTASTSAIDDIWRVDYVANEEDTNYGTYTLSSNCLQIEVPKIPCDFNPCDDLWVDEDEVSSPEDWEQDLFTAYGGYYDYESMLIDEYSDTYGEKLYKYFYDKYGDYKYPTGTDYEYTATITISTDNACSCEDGDEELIWMGNNMGDGVYVCSGTTDDMSEMPYFSVTLSVNGATIMDGNTELSPVDLGLNTGEPHGERLASSGSDLNDCSVELSDYADAVADYFNTLLGAVVSDFDISVSETSENVYRITITINSEEDLTYSPTISLQDDGHLSVSITDFVESRSDVNDFPNGNGAFNAMITHMIMEVEDESEGDDYDCYDMYLIWEGIVNDYESLRGMMLTTSGTGSSYGLDLLEYFLSFTAKKFTGFSDHEYGVGDRNAYLTSGLDIMGSSPSSNYGYGYLEYAYKSFKLDLPQLASDYLSGDLSTEDYNLYSNCINMSGVDYDDPISTWNNPEEWEVSVCGSNAWWDGSVIADDIDEGDSCKAWNMLFECINSDLNLYADDLSSDIGSACDNSPDESCINTFADYLIDRTLDVNYKRQLGYGNVIRLSVAGMTSFSAAQSASNFREYLEDNVISLTVQKDGDGNITSVGSEDELDVFYDLHNKKLNVSGSALSGYTRVPGATKKMSEILASELNAKFRKSESLSNSEVEEELSKLMNRFGWSSSSNSGSGISLNISSFLTPTFSGLASSLTRFSGASSLSFSSSAGKITLSNIADRTGALTSLHVLDLGSDDQTIVIDDLYFSWGNEMSQVSSFMKNLSISENCDVRNLTYVANNINYSLDDAKECRLENSLAEYDEHCTLPTSFTDTLLISYTIDYHHYTLFYYDIAGNLVQVVPPAGVDINSENPTLADEKNHKLLTKYEYNSWGQRISEETPDGGRRDFYYNDLGQLRFSQNAKQEADDTYEYMKYDELGRIIEAGLCSLDVADDAFADNIEDDDYPGSDYFDRVITVYGDGSTDAIITYLNDGSTAQTFIDNHIQYSYSDYDASTTGDEVYTFYSYDPHGNVEWMADSIPNMAMKYIFYSYDLTTGKVKEVIYNEGMMDQFHHRFSYDSDNRLISVETSSDGVIWTTDAQYEYYAYGPLKRLSIGADNIQGLDYIYTINGWLKAVNHQSLDSEYDPGGDGASNSSYANDVFGMTIGYFDGDFKRKYGSEYSAFNSEFNDTESEYYNTGYMQAEWDYNHGISNAIDYRPLFNGTITNVVYNTQATGSGIEYDGSVKAQKYNYDELYRLVESNFDYYSGSSWARTTTSSVRDLTDYYTSYSYDAMGNIDTLVRYSYNGMIDSLFYHYSDDDGDGIIDNNQLDYITDNVSSTSYKYDLENQSNTSNYKYDEIGELISDAKEGISNIKWTRTGKIKSLTKTMTTGSGTSSSTIRLAISFTYDAMGRRVSKTVTTTVTSGSTASIPTTETTYYVRDAKGEVVSIYTEDASGAKLSEQAIRSVNRLGLHKANESLTALDSNQTETATETYTRELGIKNYEISDYLGNVRAVINDIKEMNVSGSDTTYSANLLSSNDYLPFGMIAPGTDFSSSDYRYGYNGMERDDEIKNGGNSYDFEARFYDPRVARWLSTDPLDEKFPSESPYNAFSNDPINMTDKTGEAPVEVVEENLTELVLLGLEPYFDNPRAVLDATDNVSVEIVWNTTLGEKTPKGSTHVVSLEAKSTEKLTLKWNSAVGSFKIKHKHEESAELYYGVSPNGLESAGIFGQVMQDKDGVHGRMGAKLDMGFAGIKFYGDHLTRKTYFEISFKVYEKAMPGTGGASKGVAEVKVKIEFDNLVEFLAAQGYIDADGYVPDPAELAEMYEHYYINNLARKAEMERPETERKLREAQEVLNSGGTWKPEDDPYDGMVGTGDKEGFVYREINGQGMWVKPAHDGPHD